jgi:hypothetical protein
MKKKVDVERSSIALFISAVTVSALTMLWMLWHFPIATAALTLFVLAGVTIAARLAKTLDADAGATGGDTNGAA